MLAERSSYFQNAFAELPVVVSETPVLSFDFTAEQAMSFNHLLSFLYTDTCSLLTAGYRTVYADAVDVSEKARSSKSKRKAGAKDTVGTSTNTAVAPADPVTCLKTMARQFGVASLVKR